MADMIRGVCPQCGKKLEIPAELEEFSCLYCGARMRTEALRAKPMEERAVEALLAQLPGCITRYPDLHLRIGKKDFFPTFAQYEQDNAPLLQELDERVKRVEKRRAEEKAHRRNVRHGKS